MISIIDESETKTIQFKNCNFKKFLIFLLKLNVVECNIKGELFC